MSKAQLDCSGSRNPSFSASFRGERSEDSRILLNDRDGPGARSVAVGDAAAVSLSNALDRVKQLELQLGEAQAALLIATGNTAEFQKTEAQPRKSHEFIEAIINDLPPVVILDPGLRVVLANQSFYERFSASAALTENRLVYELGDGQWNVPKLRELLDDVLPRNSFFNDFEITCEFPLLGRRTLLLSGRRLDDQQCILLTIEDVTERLHFQAEMRRSENRYRRLFEAAKDGILIVDPVSRKITDCNPYLLDLLGYTRDEIIGKELWEIGLHKDEQANQEAFRELQDRGFIRYEDMPLEANSGTLCEVEFVSNLYHENGTSVIQCNVRDISDRKRAERELAAANEEIRSHAVQLQDHVAERTARLRETVGELEMFSYSVAHDMRAPLRAMEGFAHILMEDHGKDLPPEARAHVEYITAAALRMDSLIQDILTYTTMLNSEIKVSVIDLDVLVRQVIQTYPELHAGGVQIQIEELLPKVLGHSAAIFQCVSNLLSNAVKFVSPGTKARVRIRAVGTSTRVRVWIEDNGIGIEAKDHKRIFEMFERVSTAYEGTGIGLAIVRKSVERLRGNVGVESALGKGSKFWLEFQRV